MGRSFLQLIIGGAMMRSEPPKQTKHINKNKMVKCEPNYSKERGDRGIWREKRTKRANNNITGSSFS
jgi:hypothetical protein